MSKLRIIEVVADWIGLEGPTTVGRLGRALGERFHAPTMGKPVGSKSPELHDDVTVFVLM